MTQRIKITTNSTTELGQSNNKNFDIELLGSSPLYSANNLFKQAVDSKQINLDECLFSQYYDNDDKFLYLIQRSDSNGNVSLSEVGMGKLSSDLKFINRINPFYIIKDGKYIPSLNGPVEFLEKSYNSHLIVRNYYPANLAELFVQDYSIIASNDQEFLPVPVQIEPNSLLGRAEEEIKSISLDSILESTRESIQSYTKQLILKSSQINVRKVKTKQLLLEPHNKPDEKAGTLYYNQEDDSLSFFNGKEWKEVVMKSDN